MLHFKRCWLILVSLVLPSTIIALPYNNDRQQVHHVDVNQFSQFFSSHLLFDHLDGTLAVLSKRISLHFQSLIQVTVQPLDGAVNDEFEVDIDLLKGQLQGAVGSFIEDSLPTIWNTRSNVIDRTSLSLFIEKTTSDYCTITIDNTLLNTCIQKNAKEIANRVDQYIQSHVKRILPLIVTEDLPPLFQTTQSHVNGILAHFNHYLLKSKGRKPSIQANNVIAIQQNLENSVELTSYLEMAVNLHHQSLENASHASLQKFISLARVN
ncbi:hypothetical protein [Parasitella parasitica]|uniref:Uncharacterized protein n=1 Tax=Parasitella parasitica TaxID=35722 RepID=A0A0B7MXT3_9FUNG|nr:hypothetical protein [Parasitella parasitica]